MTDDRDKALARLREPFPPECLGKKPVGVAKDGQKSRCSACGGWLPAHQHLDFVGHAHVTDRLLEVDPEWNWEPLAFDANGLPLIQGGRMWIKLTVAGVTRLGVGSIEAGAFDAEKQLISDALRNAAMRFGVALDLWAKGDLESSLHDTQDTPPAQSADPFDAPPPDMPPLATSEQRSELRARLNALPVNDRAAVAIAWKNDGITALGKPERFTEADYLAARDLVEKAEEAPFAVTEPEMVS